MNTTDIVNAEEENRHKHTALAVRRLIYLYPRINAYVRDETIRFYARKGSTTAGDEEILVEYMTAFREQLRNTEEYKKEMGLL
jgi:hypothetical protein